MTDNEVQDNVQESKEASAAERRRLRNEAVCAYYTEGHKLSECASHFRLGRQRVLQILQAAGVWKPYEKGKRTKFLGVSVSEETKSGLRVKAEREGVSVSKLADEILEAGLKEAQ